MSRSSRGISSIQKKDVRKSAAPKKKDSVRAKVSVGSQMGQDMSGPAAPPMPPAPGFKKGGAIDGCITKGHTRGKVV